MGGRVSWLRATLAVLGVLVLLGGGLWWTRRTAATWRQGAAIAVPAAVATTGAFRLVLDDRAAPLPYHLVCVAASPAATLDVRMRTPRGISTTTVTRDCATPGATVARGTAGRTADLDTGALIEFTLLVGPPEAQQGSVAGSSTVYMLGSDGQLRAGAGSVWR